ncbi:hypothetical protein BJX66DRAFT_315744 [Aspergillus keveii]|uniref:Uncharacterized protein n=1 Tax=Aspergillus keveii TaxID=714993 RepID=A0ABR4FP41_9EURO
MIEDECKNNAPENGDHRLKLCKDGKGQSILGLKLAKSPIGGNEHIAFFPQVWDEVEEKYGISPQDAIESSVAAFKSGGVDFESDSLIGNIRDVRGDQNMKAFWPLPGIWTLLIFDFSTDSYFDRRDVEEKMEFIDEPGFNYDSDVGTGTDTRLLKYTCWLRVA